MLSMYQTGESTQASHTCKTRLINEYLNIVVVEQKPQITELVSSFSTVLNTDASSIRSPNLVRLNNCLKKQEYTFKKT